MKKTITIAQLEKKVAKRLEKDVTERQYAKIVLLAADVLGIKYKLDKTKPNEVIIEDETVSL